MHPKIKNIDMMHAPDYANMGYKQLQKKVDASKKKDKDITKEIEWVFFIDHTHWDKYFLVHIQLQWIYF